MAYSASEVVTKLQTRRDAILDELAALTSTLAGGKPNATACGVDHMGYKKSLYDELKMIDEQLASHSDAFEVVIELDT